VNHKGKITQERGSLSGKTLLVGKVLQNVTGVECYGGQFCRVEFSAA